MSKDTIKVFLYSKDLPENLPKPEEITKECLEKYRAARAAAAAAGRNSGSVTDHLRGVTLDNRSAFVKFDTNLKSREATIQDFVYHALQKKGCLTVRVPRVYEIIRTTTFLHIVMEQIDGRICDTSDVVPVAAALQELITIKGPTEAPGPVDPGPIDHCFFVEHVSSVTYGSVSSLQSHINRILSYGGFSKDKTPRVDFSREVEEYGLRLCPSDMNRGNFMRDKDNKIVAVDFGQTCFLPISFFELAINMHDPFTRRLARCVEYPKTGHLDALQTASEYLIPFGTNNLGMPHNPEA